MYIHSNANINVGNLDHVFVKYNIATNLNGGAEISCWLYLPYTHKRQFFVNGKRCYHTFWEYSLEFIIW